MIEYLIYENKWSADLFDIGFKKYLSPFYISYKFKNETYLHAVETNRALHLFFGPCEDIKESFPIWKTPKTIEDVKNLIKNLGGTLES